MMATLPTPEESARAILAIFAKHNLRAGDLMMAGQLNMLFLTGAGKGADYVAGLQYAFENDWLKQTGTTFALTDTGFAEM